MKHFKLYLIILLMIILGGLIAKQQGLSFRFFRNGFTQAKSETSRTPELMMDRMNYLDYSEQNLVNARKNGKAVLFFTATTWCTTCSALDREIKQKSNLLPPDFTILKVDYDQDKPTKNAYNVTTQHTLVVLDKNGEIKRWIGGNFDMLLQQLEEI